MTFFAQKLLFGQLSKFQRYDAQLHTIGYCHTKFQLCTISGLGGDAPTKNVAIWYDFAKYINGPILTLNFLGHG